MKAEDRRKQADEDLRRIASTRGGRRFLWLLIDGHAKAIRASFAGESTHQTAHMEGRRWVGLKVIGELQRVAPSEWVHMLSEAIEDRRLDQAAAKKEHDDGG